ncbi:MAG: hypothetical protein AUJ98_01920 [Bacteroidetes bacterium CG2_30_33_31]|nr:MAG: hypothetical protein AUJ98_01920 [Bacteroidetes bacterium CG2_30_33_31]
MSNVLILGFTGDFTINFVHYAAYYNYIIEPRYKGGEEELYKFLRNNIIYPKKALRKGIEGTVIISVYITDKGLNGGGVKQKFGKSLLDDEALRVINLTTNWIPGMVDGEPYNFTLNIPVRFTIEN